MTRTMFGDPDAIAERIRQQGRPPIVIRPEPQAGQGPGHENAGKPSEFELPPLAHLTHDAESPTGNPVDLGDAQGQPEWPVIGNLRAIEAICLDGVEPLAPPTGEPIFDFADPRDLLTEDAYQRELSPKSIDLIRRIAIGWDWRRFRPPVVVFADPGCLIIDGQHTTIAAVSRGLARIPIMVVEAAEIADRAEAFIGLNRDRLAVSAMQLHHAAVAAGSPEALTVEQVCARAGVNLVRGAYGAYKWKPGDSVAIGAIRALIDRRGVITARKMLQVLVQAGRAPVAANEIKAVEMLFTDPDYADQLEPMVDHPTAPHDVAQAIRTTGDSAEKDAKVFAAAQCVPFWKALAITWFRKTRKKRRPA